MDALVYPKERPIVALDYDHTCTTNIPFWQQFVRLAHAADYDVMIVTARHPDRIDEPQMHFGDLVRRIICTSHQAKLPYCKSIGIDPAIWIDDQPWNIHLNINGTVPNFEKLSALVPDFGTDIASYLFPKISPILIKGFGFFYSDCKYEDALTLRSFHRTKAGAYRAMRDFLVAQHVEHFKRYQEDSRVMRFNHVDADPIIKRQQRWYTPTCHAEWKIRPHVIEIKE